MGSIENYDLSQADNFLLQMELANKSDTKSDAAEASPAQDNAALPPGHYKTADDAATAWSKENVHTGNPLEVSAYIYKVDGAEDYFTCKTSAGTEGYTFFDSATVPPAGSTLVGWIHSHLPSGGPDFSQHYDEIAGTGEYRNNPQFRLYTASLTTSTEPVANGLQLQTLNARGNGLDHVYLGQF